MEAYDVGRFNVTSGQLVATDPCYGTEMGDPNTINNVKNGQWMCFIVTEDCGENWGTRIKRLCINHVDFNDDADTGLWEDTGFVVGVDSGQAGFFDATMVHRTSEELYGFICENSRDGMVGENYAVSQSGFGDGGYECMLTRDADGKVVAAIIEFISDEDDEEVYDDEFEPDADLFAEDDEFNGDPD